MSAGGCLHFIRYELITQNIHRLLFDSEIICGWERCTAPRWVGDVVHVLSLAGCSGVLRVHAATNDHHVLAPNAQQHHLSDLLGW
jgi:hypothetical protein